MTEPVPEPQINQSAIALRAEGLCNAILLAVATVGDQLAINLVAQELLDAFTEGFYAGIDAYPAVLAAQSEKSDKK